MKKAKKILLVLSILLAALIIMPQKVEALTTLDIVEKVEGNSLGYARGGYFEPGTQAPQRLVEFYAIGQFTDYYEAAVEKDPNMVEYAVPYDVFTERMSKLFTNLPDLSNYEGSVIKGYDSQTDTIRLGIGGFGDPDHIEYVTYRQNDDVYEGYGIWQRLNANNEFEDGEKVKITFILENGFLKIDGYEQVDSFPVDEAPDDSDTITYVSQEGVQFDVPANKHSLYSRVEFVTEDCDLSENKGFIIQELNADDIHVLAYNIYLKSEDKVIQLEDEIIVTLPIPEGWDAKATSVYYIDTQNNTMTDMNGVVSDDGKTISFKTDHFSVYALVQKIDEQANTTTPPTHTPTTTDQTTVTQEDTKTPQTGDVVSVTMYVGILTLSLVAMGMLISRRRKEIE